VFQVHEALSGQDVEDRQRTTGVKDSIAQKCIDNVACQRKILVEENPDISPQDLNDQMAVWLQKHWPEYTNPFLSVEGIYTFLLLSLQYNQDYAGLDPNLDTPVELLHTVLLGAIKYIWSLTCSWLTTSKLLDTFQARLASISVRGLNCTPIRASYLVQYRGSLIGRQFKQIIQVAPFAVYGLVNENLFNAWLAAGRMTATMWFPEIDNMTEYCVRCLSLLQASTH
jgi:hypothetical protein